MVEVATPTNGKDFRVLACASGDILFGPFVGPMKVKELRRQVLQTQPSQNTLKFSPFADFHCELLDNHWVPPQHDVYMSHGELVKPTDELWKRDDALYWLRKGFESLDSDFGDMPHPDLKEELDNVARTSNEFRVLGLSGEVLFGPFKGPIQVHALRQLLRDLEPSGRVCTILACSQRGLVMMDDHWIPALHDVNLILGDFAMPSADDWQDEAELSAVIKFADASGDQQMMIVDAVVGALREDREAVMVDGRHKAAEEAFQKRMSEPGFHFAFRRKAELTRKFPGWANASPAEPAFRCVESEVPGYAEADVKMMFWLSCLETWVAYVFKEASLDAPL